MNNKLPGLSRTTSKQGPENSHVESSLERRKSHLHKRRASITRPRLIRLRLQPRPTTSGRLRPIIPGQTAGAHRHNATNAPREHPSPLAFGNLFTVVCSGEGPGGPFLLEEGLGDGLGVAESMQVVQVVFAP